jgi:AraC family transcriptional regulator of adaptative response / DNA-3-methyladenine glycosylase II
MAQHEGTRPGKLEFIERAQRWRPWRAYAAQHLWSAGVTSKHTDNIEE